MTTALVVKSFRDRWRSLFWWAVGLTTMAGFQLAVYPSIKSDVAAYEELADSFPEAMKLFFDIENYTSPEGYLNVEMFSLIIPFIFLSIGVAAGAAATAGEEEKGTLDLLLALPVRRTAVVLDKFVALTLSLVVMALVTLTVILVGSRLVGLEIGLGPLVAGTAASLLIGLLYAAVALVLGAASGRRGVALGGAVALALGAFLLESLAPAASWLEPWQPLSPWYWLLGNEPVRNGLDLGLTALAVAVTAVLVAAAVLIFRRRDIAT